MDRKTVGLLAVAAIVLAGAVAASSAYALTSSVTNSSNEVTSEYISLDFQEISGTGVAATASSLTFNANDWSAADSTPTSFQLQTTGYGYSVSIESNKDTGNDPGAYLYGYFTIDNADNANSGAGIESITLKFSNYDDVVLYRDAPKNQYTLTNSISDSNSLNQWLLNISGYEVGCYDIFTGTDGVTVIGSGGTTSSNQTVSDLLSTVGLTVHLMASWTSLSSA
ncbi:MAG: hypothetical protein A3Q59_05545 [Methanomethylophilus alvi]|jgi:hypothetical protein|nr:MAG: hypothetical protein A3Q59_05545 [Methanomethylophilus alvi]